MLVFLIVRNAERALYVLGIDDHSVDLVVSVRDLRTNFASFKETDRISLCRIVAIHHILLRRSEIEAKVIDPYNVSAIFPAQKNDWKHTESPSKRRVQILSFASSFLLRAREMLMPPARDIVVLVVLYGWERFGKGGRDR